ncbi:hypothetical protein CALVIDRAFT_542783 [Calocera viscosa TUFC12733]|uniref:Uncharacterized protein n=1 Tax=Calocera viscosa (strain TUFC12733) TaxID=1330018 RepID=A0A167G8R9_CALVF|nr:hypothetical protein CALVIDRAFT_542783 [Calocera viscosa TUFC12733]
MASVGARPATLGGLPTKTVDVPICAIFLACYLALAVTNMAIFLYNLRRLKRRFRPSVFMFGFCMARLVTWSVRIAWACDPTNTTLAIVSNVFIAAGVILLWIVNRIFATRLLGEYHPRIYTKQPYSFIILRLPYVLVLCCLPMLITAVVQEFSNPGPRILAIDSIILKVALAIFLGFAASPFFVLICTYLVPQERDKDEIRAMQQRFGTGTTLTKVTVITVATALLITELSIRVATILQVYPMTAAPWYYSKATFYVVVPVFELIVLVMFVVVRVDKLFYLYGKNEVVPEEEVEEMEMA